MDVLARDLMINQLKEQIESGGKILLEKHRFLKKNRQTNELLNDVLDDYKQYYKTILFQKKQQQYQLESILEYLNEVLAYQNNITETQINKSKLQERNILQELKIIRKEIDNLIPLIDEE